MPQKLMIQKNVLGDPQLKPPQKESFELEKKRIVTKGNGYFLYWDNKSVD